MPRSPKLRRRAIIGLAGAAFLASASLAVAQIDPRPDGSPNEPQPMLKTYNCGPVTNSIVKTQNAPSSTSSVNFVQLPGAVTQVVVPDGQTRCVKVLFTVETACGLSAQPDLCYVQALDNGAPLDPNGGGFQAIASEDGSAEAAAYEWIGRLGEGVHNIRIERRVGNAATTSTYDDWTFDVEVSL
jgi:hypothetical protein